jgi:hypothetical protein
MEVERSRAESSGASSVRSPASRLIPVLIEDMDKGFWPENERSRSGEPSGSLECESSSAGTCFERPEVSASMIVESSVASGDPDGTKLAAMQTP